MAHPQFPSFSRSQLRLYKSCKVQSSQRKNSWPGAARISEKRKVPLCSDLPPAGDFRTVPLAVHAQARVALSPERAAAGTKFPSRKVALRTDVSPMSAPVNAHAITFIVQDIHQSSFANDGKVHATRCFVIACVYLIRVCA